MSPLNVFREHYPKKSAMLKFAAKELKIPGVKITVFFDRCGMWCCETTHPSGVQVWRMQVIHILIVLVIVGVVLYLVQTYIPMAAPIKTVLTVVVVLLLCLWLLSVFGVMDIPVPRVR